MKEYEFSRWLKREGIYSTAKQVSDCLSRVRRVDRAFAAYGTSIDEEFERDGCLELLEAIYHEGHTKIHDEKYPDLDLPFEQPNRAIGTVTNATKKYIVFRATTEGRFLDELESNPMIRNVFKNYYKNHDCPPL